MEIENMNEENNNSITEPLLPSHDHNYGSFQSSVKPAALNRKGCTIACRNISYRVDTRPLPKACRAKKYKIILHDVSGLFKPGVNAILGATGSGKTTLLNILAGRKDQNGLTGEVMLNGKQLQPNFIRKSGYVPQHDVVFGTLTIKENIMFSANLRLPSNMSTKEKAARVQDVISDLGLEICADQIVGTEFRRGISGGEKRRTAIGMELVVSKSILFLDEPTTGLDASTASSVAKILKRLSTIGTTVILTIHQPRYSVYKQFDNLTLLSLGKVVYQGPLKKTLPFFASQGYVCEKNDNPPDFFLDVMSSRSPPIAQIPSHATDIKHMVNESADAPGHEDLEQAVTNKLSSAYHQTHLFTKLSTNIDKLTMDDRISSLESNTRTNKTPNQITQFWYLACRMTLHMKRSPLLILMQFIIMMVFALVIGSLYFQLEPIAPAGVQNRVGVFFFIIMNMIFANLGAVELFIRERLIFVTEESNGYYDVFPYFMAKILCDIIPLRCLPNLSFAIIVYFMTGLVPDVEKFFIFAFTLMLTTFQAASVGFFVGAAVETFAMANLLVSVIYVFMMVFGGLLVNVETIWAGIQWMKYLSPFRYSFNALLINEMVDLEFYREISLNDTTFLKSVGYVGEVYMQNIGIDYETSWDLWKNICALAMLTLVFLFLAFTQLQKISKWKS